MTNEIKEILDEIKIKNDRYSHHLKYNTSYENKDEDYEAHLLLDYITNLQTIEQQYSAILSENAELQQKVNQYENPDDMTLFYMWLDAKAKDKMKHLQEENERLSRATVRYDELLCSKNNIIDKAIEYINNACNWLNISFRDDDELLQVKAKFFKEISQILQGGDNEKR